MSNQDSGNPAAKPPKGKTAARRKARSLAVQALYSWQIAGNRPAPGYAQYKSPVDGLYLAGASTHPGGGVTAASGRNVARVLLEESGLDFDELIGA